MIFVCHRPLLFLIADQWFHREKDRFTEVRKLLSAISLDETKNALETLTPLQALNRRLKINQGQRAMLANIRTSYIRNNCVLTPLFYIVTPCIFQSHSN